MLLQIVSWWLNWLHGIIFQKTEHFMKLLVPSLLLGHLYMAGTLISSCFVRMTRLQEDKARQSVDHITLLPNFKYCWWRALWVLLYLWNSQWSATQACDFTLNMNSQGQRCVSTSLLIKTFRLQHLLLHFILQNVILRTVWAACKIRTLLKYQFSSYFKKIWMHKMAKMQMSFQMAWMF